MICNFLFIFCLRPQVMGSIGFSGIVAPFTSIAGRLSTAAESGAANIFLSHVFRCPERLDLHSTYVGYIHIIAMEWSDEQTAQEMKNLKRAVINFRLLASTLLECFPSERNFNLTSSTTSSRLVQKPLILSISSVSRKQGKRLSSRVVR